MDTNVNAQEIKKGDRVTMAGFEGTVVNVCEWSRTKDSVMVEVRLERGEVCVSNHDLRAVEYVKSLNHSLSS